MSKVEADPELGAAVEKPSSVPAAAVAQKKVAQEEDPRLRWAFVRKVYAILALQFAFTAGIAGLACLIHPIPRFFQTYTVASWSVYIAILIAPFFVLWPMLKYRQKHPVNLLLLALYTFCISLTVAVVSSTVAGTVLIQATILTAVAVVGLTLFTFWAANRGYDFIFMFPFLFTSLLVLIAYLFIQMFNPVGRVGVTIYGCFATVLFSAFIIFDTNMLVKHHTYNEYVMAAISLYLDVINLFMAQLSLASIH